MTTEDLEIDRIARGMIACTLPKREWTHRAHFAAALWLLAHPDVLAAEGGMVATDPTQTADAMDAGNINSAVDGHQPADSLPFAKETPAEPPRA